MKKVLANIIQAVGDADTAAKKAEADKPVKKKGGKKASVATAAAGKQLVKMQESVPVPLSAQEHSTTTADNAGSSDPPAYAAHAPSMLSLLINLLLLLIKN